MRKIPIKAKVLWVESGKSKERPIGILTNDKRIEINQWSAALHQDHREFRVKAKEWDFLIVSRENDEVYYLARDFFSKEVDIFFPSGRKIKVSFQGKTLKLSPVGRSIKLLLWQEARSIIFHYPREFIPEIPWPHEEIQPIFHRRNFLLQLPLPPEIFPVYIYIDVKGESFVPDFLRNNIYAFWGFHPQFNTPSRI